jgi:hypothetical protein
MIVTPIKSYEVIKKMSTKYVVRIFFDRKQREFEGFWLSVKQYTKLANTFNKMYNSSVKNTEVLAVFDGDRFVWAGIEYPDYSDRNWLEKTFNAEYSDRYNVSQTETVRHIPEKIEPKETSPDADLIR